MAAISSSTAAWLAISTGLMRSNGTAGPGGGALAHAGFHWTEVRMGAMAGNVSTPGATVTSRALALIGAFDEEHRRPHADRAGRARGPAAADRPPAGRRAGRLGCAEPPPSGQYVVGRRLWDVGLLAPVQTGLRQLASPFLHDLYGATLATVHLAVRDGAEVLYLDRLAGNASVPVVSSDRLAAAAARDRRRQGAAGPCARGGADRGAVRPAPRSRRTRSPSRGRCAASWPGCTGTATRPRWRR